MNWGNFRTQQLSSTLLFVLGALPLGACHQNTQAEAPLASTTAKTDSSNPREEADQVSSQNSSGPSDFPALEASTEGPVRPRSERKVGEIVVHRFSGAFRKQPLILKEEVVAANEDSITVDFSLDEGGSSRELRVVFAARSQRVVSVSRPVGQEFLPANLRDYEEMIEKTSFAPDQNRGAIAKKSQTCLVGKKELDCAVEQYRVLVGDQEATLSVAHNKELNRDLSGEIVAVDGSLIYRAELLEMQQGHGESSSSVAFNAHAQE